jgi:RNA polymerase primary sigma factor
MASKAATMAEATETREVAEAPLFDAATAITKMLARGRERGYLTDDELNAALPPDQVSSEQIEDMMAMLSDRGITVIESEESEEPVAAKSTRLPARPAAISTSTTSAAPTIRFACICAR